MFRCFVCSEKETNRLYYLPVCTGCETTSKLVDYEKDRTLWSECSFCKENAEAKGTVYRSLVVCCDCYVEPFKLREEYKERLKELEIAEANLASREEFFESKWEGIGESISEKIYLLLPYSVCFFSLYVTFHGHHLGIDCCLCRWRGVMAVTGVVAFLQMNDFFD